MIFIAHRGNIDGPIPEKENDPNYILDALVAGYDVEVDVWYIDRRFYLGREQKKLHPVSMKFLENEHLWCHAKNIDALKMMLGNSNIRCFWHEGKDISTITSDHFIWTLDEVASLEKGIWVNIDGKRPVNYDMYGICTDYPMLTKDAYKRWLN